MCNTLKNRHTHPLTNYTLPYYIECVKNPTEYPYTGQHTKEATIAWLIELSKNHPGKYIHLHAVFGEVWAVARTGFDRYGPGDQAQSWIGGYALNGQFKEFTESQVIWEQNQGLLAD